jgi:hypothetical protein
MSRWDAFDWGELYVLDLAFLALEKYRLISGVSDVLDRLQQEVEDKRHDLEPEHSGEFYA